MTERTEAWQCIGCGRLEAAANCIGVCQDRRVELVDARDYDELQRQLIAERELRARLLDLLQQLAWSKPRSDGWVRSYVALQAQARALLEQVRNALQPAHTASVDRLDP